MSKNILLPTDLTITSLYPVHEICKNAGGETRNIYLVHTLDTPTGIMDLLFLQERKPYKMLSPSFLEALEMLRRKYASTIQLLSFEFLYAHSRAYLRHYMEGRNIGAVYMLKGYQYKSTLDQSVDCISTLQKCKLPVIHVERASHPEVGTLTTLLYRSPENELLKNITHFPETSNNRPSDNEPVVRSGEKMLA